MWGLVDNAFSQSSSRQFIFLNYQKYFLQLNATSLVHTTRSIDGKENHRHIQSCGAIEETGNELQCGVCTFYKILLLMFCHDVYSMLTQTLQNNWNTLFYLLSKVERYSYGTFYQVDLSIRNKSYPFTSKPVFLPSYRFILPSFIYKPWMYITLLISIFIFHLKTRIPD